MSKNIIPITDLRNTTEISKMCHEVNEPIYVTKNGYGDLVIMSTETLEIYETKLRDLQETLQQMDDMISVLKAEVAMANGEEVYDAKEALHKLRRELFGDV